MTDQHASGYAGRFRVRPNAASHFAWLRTRLAVERTLMAWVRTATALIGFGFTIVQFFERFGGVEGVAAVARTYAPRYVGLALIAAGILALAVSAWQYRKLIGYLRSDEFHAIAGLSEHEVQTPLLMISLVLILIGVFTFGAVFMRVL